MLQSKESEASGQELTDDEKAQLYRVVKQHTENALALGERPTEQLADVQQNTKWRALALKAEAILKYGEVNDAKHTCGSFGNQYCSTFATNQPGNTLCTSLLNVRFSTTKFQSDGKTWTFNPSVICQAYEAAASAAEMAGMSGGATNETIAVCVMWPLSCALSEGTLEN